MANLGKVVYLTEAQAQTLFANGSITVGGVTVTYSANDIYVTPTISGGLIAVQDQTPTDPNTQIWLPETQPQSVTLAELSDIPDVQINGTSIVSNGVANIPYASTSDFGVVKVGSGMYINSSNKLTLDYANDNQLKAGTSGASVIVPGTQHKSIFYGLSKLAGVDLANETVTLGTYPANAKSAIQSMLGISGGSGLPAVTSTDNGKFLRVVDGAWAAANVQNAEAVSF